MTAKERSGRAVLRGEICKECGWKWGRKDRMVG